MATPDADIPMIFDSPEEREMRVGIQERIQAEIHHEQVESISSEKRGWMHLRDGTMLKI